jgi:lysophospholipase L1-like esterase
MIFNLVYIFLLIFIFLPALIIFALYLVKKKSLLDFAQLIRFRFNKSYFDGKLNNFSSAIKFIPHPYLNWSLNPSYKNIYGNFVHTKEGFRKTLDYFSIIDYLEDNPHTYKIICIGGSTTHCADIENFEETWPALLQKKLGNNNFTVINFGVGAWTTLQSYIRCVSWFPKIEPNLLVFYHAKNDLTPLLNGNLKQKKIFPDYQNIITQFSDRFFISFKSLSFIPLFFLISFFTNKIRNQIGMLSIYKPKAELKAIGIERFDDDYLKSLIFRQEAIVNLCKQIDCSVLYIPEIVKEGVYRDTLIKDFFPTLKTSLSKHKNLHWFDVDKQIPYNSEYFWDKMHFTIGGNKLFSEILYNKIIKHYIDKN